MKNRVSTIRILVLCVVLFTAAGVLAGPDDVVKIGLQYDPGTMNMLQLKTGIEIPAILPMHQILMLTDPWTGERTFESSLTESAEVLENGKDIKFKLVSGNTFHTGDPLTAYDIKFTYEQCANPSNANLMAAPLDEIEDIEIIDDYTFIFRFYEPYAAWRELLWIGICSQKYYEKVGPKQFGRHPVGSGPFKFVERRIGEYITLKADPNYKWTENVPYTDPDTGEQKTKAVERKIDFGTLKFITVPDDITRVAMLETGELDLITDILPHHVKRLKRNKHVVIKTDTTQPSLYALSSKADNYPIWKDAKFALSITYAINRKEIVDKIFLGQGYPLYMFASRSELITLTYTSAVPNADLVAATIQKYLQDVGVTIKLQKLEAGTQATYSRNRNPKEGHMTLYAWAGGRDPSTRLLLTMPSTSMYNAWKTRKAQKQIDSLTYAQARETDRDKRLVLLNELHSLLRDEPSAPVLFGLNQIYAMQNRIDYSWQPGDSFVFGVNRIKIVK
ncbi:MAG: ABC transporter substrate-binding protein [Deltaproteobacteria bacterium]|nr:ABC transporter substrate-binding protein [Deltaproteobacteria bacterium]